MLKKVALTLAIVLSVLILSGCDLLFQEKKSGGELAYALEIAEDGSYILAGARQVNDLRSAALLARVDTQGNEEWSQVFEMDQADLKAYSVRQTRDGGYVIAGVVEPASSGQTGNNAFLIKTDGRGNREWAQTFGGGDNDYIYCVQQTRDEGFMLAGYTWSYGGGRFNAWLIKADDRGNEEWSRTFRGSEMDIRAHIVQQTEDGGYILAGGALSAGGYPKTPWLLKTDALGDEEWSQTFDKSGQGYGGYANAVQQTADGGFMVLLSGYPYFNDRAGLRLVKIDALGNEEWSRPYEGSNRDDARSMLLTEDGGYILAGGSETAWLLKVDASGNEEWAQVFGEAERVFAYSVKQVRDGGFALAGNTWPGDGAPSSAWLIKTDGRGGEEWAQSFGEEYIIGHTATPGLILFVAFPLALLVFNLISFLFFSRDMEKREEKKWTWLPKFLLLGPLAATWYGAYRKPLDAEAVRGSTLYRLARSFAFHWTVFWWLFPAFILFVTTLAVGLGYVLVGALAVLLGTGFLFILAWLAVWLAPLAVSAIVMLAASSHKSLMNR